MTATASLPLFDLDPPLPPYVRSSETSQAAARVYQPKRGPGVLRVCQALDGVPDGLTDHQIKRKSGLGEDTHRARRIDGCRLGLIEPTGEKREWDGHGPAMCYRLTKAGGAFLASEGETR